MEKTAAHVEKQTVTPESGHILFFSLLQLYSLFFMHHTGHVNEDTVSSLVFVDFPFTAIFVGRNERKMSLFLQQMPGTAVQFSICSA